MTQVPLSQRAFELQKIIDARRAELGIVAAQPKSRIADFLQSVVEKIPAASPELTADQIAERDLQDEKSKRRRDNWAKNECFRDILDSVGKRYENARLENYVCEHPSQNAAVDALREYAVRFAEKQRDGSGVILFGPAGTGKDHLLIGLAHHVIGLHCVSRRYDKFEDSPSLRFAWTDGMEFFSGLRAGMNRDNFDECRFVDSLVRPDVLIISDPIPPQGSLTDYQAAMLFRVIDGRYRECLPTWATLNVATRKETEDRMTVQIVDRLKHGALCVQCNWPSHRKVARNIMAK